MGVTQPPYPRIPHLAPGQGATRDDLVLSTTAREKLLEGRVRIEEKLDGGNIGIAVCAEGSLQIASRGGPETNDRGGHLGRARAWAAARSDELHQLLSGGWILYGEWLLTRHSIRYDALPDLFVGFDLLDPTHGWASVHDRDVRLHEAGIASPPTFGEFYKTDLKTVDALIGPSGFGAPRIEGVIVRTLETCAEVPRIAKRLAEGVPRVTDDAFGRSREKNRVADSVSQV
jgi:hypothetical protein